MGSGYPINCQCSHGKDAGHVTALPSRMVLLKRLRPRRCSAWNPRAGSARPIMLVAEPPP
jgi:hypothetical protein